MKKLLSFWPPSLDMPLKSSWTFTMPIPLNLCLCHSFSLDIFTCSIHSKKIHSKKKIIIQENHFFYFYNTMFTFTHSSPSPNSDFSNTSPSNSESITLIHCMNLSKAAAVLFSASHLLTISDTRVSIRLAI